MEGCPVHFQMLELLPLASLPPQCQAQTLLGLLAVLSAIVTQGETHGPLTPPLKDLVATCLGLLQLTTEGSTGARVVLEQVECVRYLHSLQAALQVCGVRGQYGDPSFLTLIKLPVGITFDSKSSLRLRGFILQHNEQKNDEKG